MAHGVAVDDTFNADIARDYPVYHGIGMVPLNFTVYNIYSHIHFLLVLFDSETTTFNLNLLTHIIIVIILHS